MTNKPITFNKEMVRAILDGRKSVTRRVVKPQPPENDPHNVCFDYIKNGTAKFGLRNRPPYCIKTPYRPSDILYVPEAWKCSGTFGELGYEVEFRDGQHIKFKFEDRDRAKKWAKYRDKPSHQWQSPYFMPREAARLFIRVTDVQIERLQDITEEQAKAEGAPRGNFFKDGIEVFFELRDDGYYVAGFEHVWGSTIKKDDLPRYGWSANPWVWVIKFKKLERADNP